jgi:hypothetical protein
MMSPPLAQDEEEWSPLVICEAFAEKKGYRISKGHGRLDAHRAGREIVQVRSFSAPSAALCCHLPLWAGVRGRRVVFAVCATKRMNGARHFRQSLTYDSPTTLSTVP